MLPVFQNLNHKLLLQTSHQMECAVLYCTPVSTRTRRAALADSGGGGGHKRLYGPRDIKKKGLLIVSLNTRQQE